ncbi:LytTR family DNA-binding domain-containing protein [Muricauda ruestringensis]|uniref:LytR/AlgR family response regulator transcription factor n=1 Tax=Flagellimonas ruestringensis TaxID=111501 RepID=UPI001CD5A5D0|nr:LytTR family DNA-binding domain-containing protein [Allomuricauda ruestringensis]MCA0957942.1 LytTR family DNA-binding domain-containing protein [Allomuricauda ruestringensis]
MGNYSTLIIDDERLAREEVRRALEHYPEFTIIGEANNVEVAKVLVEKEQPDLIFLDIHMPGKSGFDLLEELGTVPEVVFTTAYDQYAVQAFEVNALDYLVKPLREERFAKTIEKVKLEFKKQEEEQKVPLASHQKIFIKDGEKVYFIALAEVSLIESMDNYARLYFGDEKPMIKRSLNQLEKRLDPAIFFRANRSQIINTEYIKEIQPYFNNKLRLVLTTGEIVDLSSRQSVSFKKRNSL